MRSVEDQLQRILASAVPLDSIEVPLQDARGCVLASDITTENPIPSFDTAAVDGYAARAADLSAATADAPVVLSIVDDQPTDDGSTPALAIDRAIKVSAGTMVPAGANVVIPAQDTRLLSRDHNDHGDKESDRDDDGDRDRGGDRVRPANRVRGGYRVRASSRIRGGDRYPKGNRDGDGDGDQMSVAVFNRVNPGHGVRQRGSDVPAGWLVVPAGTELFEREIAAVVAAGRSRLPIYPHPRVVIITIGDALVTAGSELGPGEVHDVNGATLAAAASAAGAIAYRGGPVPENAEKIATLVQDQLVRADLVIVTGGTSMEADQPVGPAVDGLNSIGEIDFTPTAVDPGPIIGFGKLGTDQVPVIAIPRDPAGALIAFEVFVRPMIRLLAGRSQLFRPVVRATLSRGVTAPTGVRRFVPSVISLRETTLTSQVSIAPLAAAMTGSPVWLQNANALAIVPEDATSVNASQQIAAIRLDRG